MIGLGSYSFFWRGSTRMPAPLDLNGQLCETAKHGVHLFQICDWAPLAAMSDQALHDTRQLAADLDITLEIGTKGIAPVHLELFLMLAERLGARLVRSMLFSQGSRPTIAIAEDWLRAVLPAYEASGVTLALETYEQAPTDALVKLVEVIGSPALGICLDPANSVAALEHPNDVIDRCAPHAVSLHIKDFRFARRDGWVGFTLEGAEFGTGLLDYHHLRDTVQPDSRGINQIVEHWLPWQADAAETARLEARWTAATLAGLSSTTNARSESE